MTNPSIVAAVPAAAPAVQQVTLTFSGKGPKALITWKANVLGEIPGPFTSPYPDPATLVLVIKALDAVQYLNHPLGGPQFTVDEQETLGNLGLWKGGRVPDDAYKKVGQALYKGLGGKGRSALEAVRNNGIAQNLMTNYVLCFSEEAVGLAMLPWESLTDPHQQAVLLSRGKGIDSCERYVLKETALSSVSGPASKLHLLALSPSFGIPKELREEERVERLQIWDKLVGEGTISYDELPRAGTGPLTRVMLTDYLADPAHPLPDIIHYFGHGGYRNGKGFLLFDKQNGAEDPVSAEKLAVAGLGNARLVVLYACQSAQVGEANGLLTGVAPALSLVGGAVVAMQLSMRIEEAMRFSQVFYRELLVRRRSLQEAVAMGRQTLFFEYEDQASWYVPALYIRGRNQEPVYLVK